MLQALASLALSLALGLPPADRPLAPQDGAAPQRSSVEGRHLRGEHRLRALRHRMQRLEARLRHRAALRDERRERIGKDSRPEREDGKGKQAKKRQEQRKHGKGARPRRHRRGPR